MPDPQQPAEGQDNPDAQKPCALGPILADPVLGVLADVLDDLEAVRVANENRLRTLTDRSEHGHGLTLHNPQMAKLAAIVDTLKDAEHQAILNLQRSIRAHPLGVWAKQHRGLGEKQLARLLATIGDPFWNDLHNRPRKVSELWAFCGYHVIRPSGSQPRNDNQRSGAAGSTCPPDHLRFDNQTTNIGWAPKRQRGQRSNWSEDARKRAWLIAASCVKQPAGTRYRDIYDATRAKYADATHAVECVRCGPKGNPAQPGSPLSLGHQHHRGLRAISKALLKDLWLEARRIHEATGMKDAA